MQNHLRKIGFVVWVLTLLFFFSTALLSAHAHAKSHGDRPEHCVVCQFNHGGNQRLQSDTNFNLLELLPIAPVSEKEFPPIFSDPLQVPSIRGPPLAN